ncbi:hypothetical protein FQR65_LT18242 [Abscondita terminalis]|nr:hypothetical protein FQR65_LT18242 [Abscondita terminalis]
MDKLIFEEINQAEEVQESINVNRHPKIYQEHKNPFDLYSEIQFKKRYRMQKETARYILNLIRAQITPLAGNRGRPVSPEIQFLSTITCLSKGAYEEDMSDLSQFHQSTLSRIIQRVVRALAELRNRFIKFPETENEIRAVKRDFYELGCYRSTYRLYPYKN